MDQETGPGHTQGLTGVVELELPGGRGPLPLAGDPGSAAAGGGGQPRGPPVDWLQHVTPGNADQHHVHARGPHGGGRAVEALPRLEAVGARGGGLGLGPDRGSGGGRGRLDGEEVSVAGRLWAQGVAAALTLGVVLAALAALAAHREVLAGAQGLWSGGGGG